MRPDSLHTSSLPQYPLASRLPPLDVHKSTHYDVHGRSAFVRTEEHSIALLSTPGQPMLLRHSQSKPKPRQNWAIQNEFSALYLCQELPFSNLNVRSTELQRKREHTKAPTASGGSGPYLPLVRGVVFATGPACHMTSVQYRIYQLHVTKFK